MRRRSNEIVSLLEFVRTGKFGRIELRQTKEYIQNSCYKPDDKNYMGNDLSIWRYSTFELHFSEDKLYSFWCDSLSWLKSPKKKQFKLNKWLFNDLSKLTFSYFCYKLDELHILYSVNGTFSQNDQPLPDNIILSVDNTDVVIYFEAFDETVSTIEQYKLIGIGASETKITYNVRPL